MSTPSGGGGGGESDETEEEFVPPPGWKVVDTPPNLGEGKGYMVYEYTEPSSSSSAPSQGPLKIAYLQPAPLPSAEQSPKDERLFLFSPPDQGKKPIGKGVALTAFFSAVALLFLVRICMRRLAKHDEEAEKRRERRRRRRRRERRKDLDSSEDDSDEDSYDRKKRKDNNNNRYGNTAGGGGGGERTEHGGLEDGEAVALNRKAAGDHQARGMLGGGPPLIVGGEHVQGVHGEEGAEGSSRMLGVHSRRTVAGELLQPNARRQRQAVDGGALATTGGEQEAQAHGGQRGGGTLPSRKKREGERKEGRGDG